MERLKRWIASLVTSERGQDMVEYAMLTMFISVAIVLVTLGLLSPAFGTWAGDLASCVEAPGSCPL